MRYAGRKLYVQSRKDDADAEFKASPTSHGPPGSRNALFGSR